MTISIEKLACELAKVLWEQDQAHLLLRKAGFPREHMPPNATPLSFWMRILEKLENGALHGGIRHLVKHALRLFPANHVFMRASIQDEFEEEGDDDDQEEYAEDFEDDEGEDFEEEEEEGY